MGEDEARWGITGLLHDFDWEIHPTAAEHPELGCRMLEELGWPADVVRAIRGHATYLNVPRDTPMAKALFACDELTGFIGAVVAVRPNKTIREVRVESVRKKLKDRSFAAKVDRDGLCRAVPGQTGHGGARGYSRRQGTSSRRGVAVLPTSEKLRGTED